MQLTSQLDNHNKCPVVSPNVMVMVDSNKKSKLTVRASPAFIPIINFTCSLFHHILSFPPFWSNLPSSCPFSCHVSPLPT